MLPQLIQETTRPDGSRGLRYNFHDGQYRAWESRKRFLLVLAGTQSGKTSWGPLWLHREILTTGPGDYMVVAPTYPLLNLKALPEFLALFKRRLDLGEYNGQARCFTFHDGQTRVLFCHAQDPDSLESATAKAAWLDEAGQKKFRLGSWEAVQRRLSIHQGRALITTTPYDLGWLKQRLWDPWNAAKRQHTEIDVVGFPSIANPTFPREEYERARRELPRWKFDLFYRAIFTRPAGMIYDSFDTERHLVPRFAIPLSWPRYLGLDFGNVNTAGVFLAEEQTGEGDSRKTTGRYFVYRTYGPCGGRTAKEHVEELLKDEPRRPVAIGGAASEDKWREEFCNAGLGVREPPVSEVEVGINRVYSGFQTNELLVFNDLHGLTDDLGSYSREVDEMGEPTEKIEDKETYHLLDSLRYAMSYLRPAKRKFTIGV